MVFSARGPPGSQRNQAKPSGPPFCSRFVLKEFRRARVSCVIANARAGQGFVAREAICGEFYHVKWREGSSSALQWGSISEQPKPRRASSKRANYHRHSSPTAKVRVKGSFILRVLTFTHCC